MAKKNAKRRISLPYAFEIKKRCNEIRLGDG